MSRIFAGLVCVVIALETASASQIIWQSSRAAHETSSGQALDSSYIFELGVFTETFVPTEFNVSEWANNWQLADRTVYDPTSRAFTSRHEVEENTAPFFIGERGYIWGYSTTSQEWFLMTSPSWTWPDANRIGFPLEWTTMSAANVVVGSISDTGGQTHMRTKDIGSQPLPVLTRTAWQETVFTSADQADPEISAWSADPDHDGHDNLLEYALGGDPLVFDHTLGLTAVIERPAGQAEVLILQLTRLPSRLATPIIELSNDLVGWDGLGNAAEEDTLWSERISLQWHAIQRQFVRVKVNL